MARRASPRAGRSPRSPAYDSDDDEVQSTEIFQHLIDKIVVCDKEEERAAHADSLGVAVENFWKHNTRAAHEEESNSLEAVMRHLIQSPEQSPRLAGIAAYRALLERTTNEAYKSRVQRTGLALKILESYDVVKYGDLETSKASTDLLRLFAKEKGKAVSRLAKNFLLVSLDDLVCPDNFAQSVSPVYFRARMSRNCLVVTKLGPLFPSVVTKFATDTATAVLRLTTNKLVRDHAVSCLSAILTLCTPAPAGPEATTTNGLDSVFDEVRQFLRNCLDPNLLDPASTPPGDTSKVEGAIIIIGSLLNNPSLKRFIMSALDNGNLFYFELGVYLLDYRRCVNVDVQRSLAAAFPHLAAIDPGKFRELCIDRQSFEFLTVNYLLERARAVNCGVTARTEAVRAAGEIAVIVGATHFQPYLADALALCSDLMSEVLRGSCAQQQLRLEREGVRGGSEDGAVGEACDALQPNTVLDFVKCVTRATQCGDKAYVVACKVLLAKMFRMNVSAALMDALQAVIDVVKERDAYIQNVVMKKVEKVFVEAAASTPSSSADAPVRQVPQCGTPPVLPAMAVDGLFLPRSQENSEPGYVSALMCLRRRVSGTEADYESQDVAFNLELQMDPTLRQDTTGPGVAVKATPRIALKMLATFRFDTVPPTRLAWFANQFVVSYLESPSIVERRIAIQAITNLMKYAAAQKSDVGGLRDKTFMVLSQLVSVAVVDPSRRVRLTVLVEISRAEHLEHFQLYLGQPETLPVLGMCLHDEDVGVRGQALKLLCRLHKKNRGDAEPILTQFILHLFTVLRCPSETFAPMRAQASRLLQMLIRDAPDFVQLYSTTAAETLLVCLQTQLAVVAKVDPSSMLPVVEAIGDLAAISGVVLKPYVFTLVPLLVMCVMDVDATTSDQSFRTATLRGLACVVQNTALDCKPYVVDPRLLASLLSNLKGEANPEIRRQTLHLLGAIGAVNPDRDDIKYVALPSSQMASTTGASSGVPVYYRVLDGHGVPGVVGVHPGSVMSGAMGSSVGAALFTGPFNPSAAHTPVAAAAGTVTRQLDVAWEASTPATSRPPLVANGARGVDFTWMDKVLARKVPVWFQSQLQTDSLVSRLVHPYTDSEQYFPSIVLDVLHRIVGTPRHKAQHLEAVESIVLLAAVIKKSNKCSYFLPSIVPRLLWMLQPVNREGRIPVSDHLEQLFESLGRLVAVVKKDFEEYLPDTISLCYAYLTDDDLSYRQSAVAPVAALLKAVCREIGPPFRPYAAYMMGPLISALVLDTTAEYTVTACVVSTLDAFGSLFAQYSATVLPALVAAFENTNVPREVRARAIATIGRVVQDYDAIPELLSSVLHPLMRILAATEETRASPGTALASAGSTLAEEAEAGADVEAEAAAEAAAAAAAEAVESENTNDADRDAVLARAAARAIRDVARRAPAEFTFFVPVVAKALVASKVRRTCHEYKCLEGTLLESSVDVAAGILGVRAGSVRQLGSTDAADAALKVGSEMSDVAIEGGPPSGVGGDIAPLAASLVTNSVTLMEAFNIDHSRLDGDWSEWLDRLGVALLENSGAPAMRAVARTAEMHPHLFRQLFNAAFLSVWPKLETDGGEHHQKIVAAFEDALKSKTIPLPVKQTLLDLFEFMDHDERPLPIDGDLLTRAAVEVGAFAKALRHKETEYSSAQSDKDLQKVVSDRCGLIEIYNNLGHTVSAEGTLTDVVVRMADKSVAREVKEQYNETLLLLPEALKAYKNAAEKLPGGIDLSTVDACSEARGKQLHKARARANGGRERALGGVNGVGPPAAGGPPGVHVMNPPRNADGTLQTPTTDEEFNATSLPEQDRDLKWFLTLAQLRVLDSLGEWRVMEDMAHDAWTQTDGNNAARASLAVDGRACSVAFDLSEWGQFKERVEHIHGTNDWDEHFYKSLLCVQEGKEDASKLADASRHIQRAMEILDAGLRTRAAEGYPRAYGDFLNAQHLVELDEMVRCIRVGMPAAGKKRLKDLWGARLNDAKEDQHTWYRLLMIRSLLLNPMENKDQWLKFATKCRKNRRLPMATEALRKLVGHIADTHGVAGEGRGVDAKSCAGRLLAGEDGKFLPVKEWTAESMLAIPERAVQFACIKHLWASDEQGTAFQALKGCFLNDAEMRPSVPPQFGLLRGEEDVGLQAEILLKLAKWSDRIISRPALAGGASDASPPRPAESLAYAKKATEWSPVWYKSWHFWAALNVKQAEKAVRSLEERRDAHSASSASRTRAARTSLDFDSKLPPMNDGIVKQLTCAIDGYFNAIKYGGKTGLEDVLTLLRLWFRYGSDPALSDVFNRGFLQSAPDCWLEVVPQLIARLYTPHVLVRKGIEKLLIRVGLAHPHAAVYPLTVAENTPGRSKAQEDRRKSACAVLTRMRGQHKAIVEQAKLVAVELNRVAILEHEKWYDRIEEASRLYYSEHDVIGMLDALRSLHDAMANQAPETECEESFRRDYGADLTRADQYGREFLTGYKARLNDGTDDPAELQRQQGLIERAWELYYQVFRRIQRQQGSMNSLDMRSVSPALQRCKDMVLAIPGKYRPFGDDPVKIARFDPRLDVMQSKMRPRKLDMIGSDGRPYGFLLKGHDDLRQDERVMQVFGLINQHLAQSGERSVRQGAQLKRYAVIVLSSNAGLIEWVPDCDTMHALVKTFRENRRVMPNVEHKVMLRVAPEPERLPLLHKVDLFEFMLQNTGGRDIARVLWLRSRNSEMWLDRRTNFARTLATTSMAGYILGLGDRHPSNIMIERETGKIMHIDFGDCFEVAMRRDKYPEKVPFRLTRMLVHALEPCGVRGHFRHMAVGMMRVLRHENACKAMESMMEAFVFDPLIRQKLLDAAELETGSTDRAPAGSPTGGGVTPSGRIAEQYAQGGSLAEVLRMETGGPAVADEDVMAHQGPTPSQQSRSRRESVIGRDGELSAQFAALANDRAREAIGRVLAKLSGRDFEDSAQPLSVEDQVDRLVDEAQNVEHLCQLFPGWVASW